MCVIPLLCVTPHLLGRARRPMGTTQRGDAATSCVSEGGNRLCTTHWVGRREPGDSFGALRLPRCRCRCWPGSAVLRRPAARYPSDATPPNLVTLLGGFNQLWQSGGTNDFRGKVLDAKTLQTNDQLAVWINNSATATQRFRALQDSVYNDATNAAYDESLTISTGLGSILGPLYVKGTESGALPLTQALINSSNGTAGAYVDTGTPKGVFDYPRPYLPVNASAPAVPGDTAGCAPSLENASSLKSIRVGQPYADTSGNLKIQRVPDVIDTTHQFSPNDVALSVVLRLDRHLCRRVLPERACHHGIPGRGHTGDAAARTRAGDLGPRVRGRQRPHRSGRPLPARRRRRPHRRGGGAGRPLVGRAVPHPGAAAGARRVAEVPAKRIGQDARPGHCHRAAVLRQPVRRQSDPPAALRRS